ncbi:MAG TPA: DUF5942 domain-containing protein [Myxococcales bacterium]|jgi:hypothetical protein|nr:DUF5942 domain-containing protein [Myxococcales bacterium]
MKRVTAGLAALALALPVAALACPESFTFTFSDVEPYQLMLPRAFNALSPVAWALGLLALAVISVRERKRPAFFQVAFAPGFIAGATLATTGAFFLRWLPLDGTLFHGLSLPLPDMDQLVFGAGLDANPLFYSALIPAAVSAAGIRFQGARRLVAGVACGFAGTLAAAAWHGWPELSVLSARWVSLPWLAANAVACCFIARAMFVAEARDVGSPRSAR